MQVPNKQFSESKARQVLAHSKNFDGDSVAVDEAVFRQIVHLPERLSLPKPLDKISQNHNWGADEKDGYCPEKDFKEWEAYFHPENDFQSTQLLFNRTLLEQEAGMSAGAARQRYGQTDPGAELQR